MLDLLGISAKTTWLSILAGSYSNAALLYKELGSVFYMKTTSMTCPVFFKNFLCEANMPSINFRNLIEFSKIQNHKFTAICQVTLLLLKL